MRVKCKDVAGYPSYTLDVGGWLSSSLPGLHFMKSVLDHVDGYLASPLGLQNNYMPLTTPPEGTTPKLATDVLILSKL